MSPIFTYTQLTATHHWITVVVAQGVKMLTLMIRCCKSSKILVSALKFHSERMQCVTLQCRMAMCPHGDTCIAVHSATHLVWKCQYVVPCSIVRCHAVLHVTTFSVNEPFYSELYTSFLKQRLSLLWWKSPPPLQLLVAKVAENLVALFLGYLLVSTVMIRV